MADFDLMVAGYTYAQELKVAGKRARKWGDETVEVYVDIV